MTRIEVTHGPAGDRRWMPAWPDGTDIDVMGLSPGTQNPRRKWQLLVGGTGEWNSPKTVVPGSQIQLIKRANILNLLHLLS